MRGETGKSWEYLPLLKLLVAIKAIMTPERDN
jgi:hypothetical protein